MIRPEQYKKEIRVENNLTRLFEQKSSNLLSIYCTAGYPELEDTLPVIKAIEKAGSDMVEIGIPFSDPLADGPTIQQSNQKALQNGMSLHKLFKQIGGIRNEVQIPVLLMGYLNPVLQYGIEAFCARCEEVGIDGLILPDLPFDLYLQEYEKLFYKHNLSNIFLITPHTKKERIHHIDSHSTGFIYAVSSASTTGTKTGINDTQDYLQNIGSMELRNPILTGFNIHDKQSFQLACKYTSGAIIGSAFIKTISQTGNLEKKIHDFITKIKIP
jgi:tryptophan synthase alpha chain